MNSRERRRRDRARAAEFPTLWQILASLQDRSFDLNYAYRLARAHVRAAGRRQAAVPKSKR
jgi:hypothetical protein